MQGIYISVGEHEIPNPLPPELFEAAPSHGGEVIFFGRVRNRNQGRNVVSLSYDAFVPLAEATLHEIATEARIRWGTDLCITVVHRTGRLPIGGIAVVVAVSSAHRGEAFAANQYLISELKHRAPLWKKEYYEDGESEWLQGHALCGHSQSHAGPSGGQL